MTVINSRTKSGDVFGPSSATDNAVARFDLATGKLIQNSLVIIDDTGNITLPALSTFDGRDVSVDGTNLDNHIANTSNPHSVTKSQVGLGNVTNDAQLKIASNLSDLANVSTARNNLGLSGVAASGSHLDLSNIGTNTHTQIDTHIASTSNPHGVTKTQVGLSAVTNDAQLKIASNLSDLNNAATARTNLGLVIGTDVQAHDAELAAIAGLVSAADTTPYFTGSGTASLATLTTFARSLIDDVDSATARSTLGLGTLATLSSLSHGALTSLAVDDHTQYALLAGRAGGQTLIGGTNSGDDLTLQTTSNATKGRIIFGSLSGFEESTGQLGIGQFAASSTGMYVSTRSTLSGTTQRGLLADAISSSAATTATIGIQSQVRTQAASYTSITGSAFQSATASLGAGSFVTNLIGFDASAQTAGTTLNLGFRGLIDAAATGGYNLYMLGSAPNYLAGSLSVGVTTASAKAHVLSTTEQLRIGYDASNYFSTTVGSTGVVTFNAVGSGSAFSFSDPVQLTNTGLRIDDTDGSHCLIISPGSNLTANRTLTLTTADANRTITISGDSTISQDYSASGTPRFAALGIGVAASSTAAIIVAKNTTDPVATTFLMNFTSTANTITADNANGLVGISSDIRMNQAGFDYTATLGLRAVNNAAYATGSSGTVTTAIATASGIANTGAGTLTNGTALFVGTALNSGGGTLTNNTGLEISAQTAGTNIYGIRSRIASSASRYNLYIDGTAQNYLSGNLGVGTTSPSTKIHVISTTEQLRLGYDSSNYFSTTIGSTGGVTFDAVGAGAAFTFSDNVSTTGSLTSTGTAGIGYSTGSGGTVTQITSRTTGVTINKTCGAITLVSAAGTTSWQSFTVTNSTVQLTDSIIVSQKSGTDLYLINVTNIAAGSFRITFATTAGTTTEQPVFVFSVIKSVTS